MRHVPKNYSVLSSAKHKLPQLRILTITQANRNKSFILCICFKAVPGRPVVEDTVIFVRRIQTRWFKSKIVTNAHMYVFKCRGFPRRCRRRRRVVFVNALGSFSIVDGNGNDNVTN